MIVRKRIPAKDDKSITQLVRKTLLPYAKWHMPEQTFGLKQMRERLKKGATWVITDQGRLQGFIHVKKQHRSLHISLLAIKPSAQGKGLGSRLMRRAEKYAHVQSLPEIYVFADRANLRAIRFYQLHGYTIRQYISQIDNYVLWKKKEGKSIEHGS